MTTVGDVLAALGTLRPETPVLRDLGSGGLAGPTPVPWVTEGAPLAEAPGHYVTQARGLDGSVPVVVLAGSVPVFGELLETTA